MRHRNISISENFKKLYGKQPKERQSIKQPKDKNNTPIKEGDIVLTDEAGWKGTAVKYGDYYIVDKFSKEENLFAETLVLIDDKGGFSLQPNWKNCERKGKNYLIAGRNKKE